MGVVRSILGYLTKKEVAMPIQVERDLKISRCLVFGSMIIMEGPGQVKPVAKRANWKLYRITDKYRVRGYWPRTLLTASTTLSGVDASTPKSLI